jgi:ATP-dependent DNA helicase RecG
MITENQLKQLLSDLESDRVERTVSTSKTDKFAEAVCAFANDFPNHGQPGYLLIGVDDNGAPNGLRVTDDILKNLAALRSDGNIQPMPASCCFAIIRPVFFPAPMCNFSAFQGMSRLARCILIAR